MSRNTIYVSEQVIEESNADALSAGNHTESDRMVRDMCEDFLKCIKKQSLAEQNACLWNLLKQLQGKVFYTMRGLKYTYMIKGRELFVDRKEKSITQSSVFVAFRRALELGNRATGPKKLGTFGASYIYPIFVSIGIIKGNNQVNTEHTPV